MKPTSFLKSITALFTFLMPTVSLADIIDANEAYEAQNYKSALNQYLDLAQLGSNQAKYNVAVMYFKGLGTEKDLAKALGWAQLVDENENKAVIPLLQTIKQELNTGDTEAIIAAANEITEQYGHDVILQKLAPIAYQDKNSPANDTSQFELVIIDRPAPKFPMSALRSGTQGWVRTGFDVYPDGSVRNIYVIESVPEGVFDEVTIEAINQFRFKVTYAEDVEPYPVSARQMIQYELAVKDKEKLTNRYQEHLDKLKKFADKGHPDAQYYYALAASSQSLISNYVKLDEVEVNQWLLKAAQNGQLEAQYLLGQNILSGKGCKVEKQKGINWIVNAANQGHAKSARKSYHLLTKNNQLNQTNLPPEFWLKKAAENGDPESQLEYAHFLVFSQTDATLIAEAEDYLKRYLKARDKSVKYHQTMAQIYKLNNHDKKAQKELKKAEKMAKKLGWEI